MDAFDTDVLIYAATPGNRRGDVIARRFTALRPGEIVGCGSTLLIPELLIKPRRLGSNEEVNQLWRMLSHLRLRPPDRLLAELAVTLGAAYGLKSTNAIHLATAVTLQADRFITNNRNDFDKQRITEIDITYPDDLDAASEDDESVQDDASVPGE